MKIEAGDIIWTGNRRLEVLTIIYDSVIVCDMECRWVGKETYVLPSVISLCINKVWGLEKATKQLDMSVLEEL
jgi:hypothetical protein